MGARWQRAERRVCWWAVGCDTDAASLGDGRRWRVWWWAIGRDNGAVRLEDGGCGGLAYAKKNRRKEARVALSLSQSKRE